MTIICHVGNDIIGPHDTQDFIQVITGLLRLLHCSSVAWLLHCYIISTWYKIIPSLHHFIDVPVITVKNILNCNSYVARVTIEKNYRLSRVPRNCSLDSKNVKCRLCGCVKGSSHSKKLCRVEALNRLIPLQGTIQLNSNTSSCLDYCWIHLCDAWMAVTPVAWWCPWKGAQRALTIGCCSEDHRHGKECRLPPDKEQMGNTEGFRGFIYSWLSLLLATRKDSIKDDRGWETGNSCSQKSHNLEINNKHNDADH